MAKKKVEYEESEEDSMDSDGSQEETLKAIKKKQADQAKVSDFISRNSNGTVYITDKVSYNLKDIIEDNHRLYNSQYEQPLDNTGLEKIFFNIGWIMYRTVFYSSDIDQKDLQMRATNPNAVGGVALVRMAVENYLSRIHFGKTMDEIRAYMIAHGTAITKVAHGEPMLVDLRNVIRPPHIENIQDSGVCERVYYSYEEMMELTVDDAAKEYIHEMWERMQKENIYMFPVYEFWHQFEINGKLQKGCQRWLDCEMLMAENQQTNQTMWEPYCFLDEFKTPYKKRRTSRAMTKKFGEYEDIYPYMQMNFIDVPGRWLGFGTFELLKGLQVYYNEKWHLYRKKDILDLRGIFKHQKGVSNASLEQRFLDAMETGAFIDLEQDENIERLIIDMKTGEFVASIDKIMELARQIIGVTAQGIGQDMPSTTTATVGILNQKSQQTTYDYVIERCSHGFTALFEDFYMATILEEISEEEMFQIVGDPSELRELDNHFIENQVNTMAHEFKMQNGFYPQAELVDSWRDEMKSKQETFGDMRFAELKKDVIEAIPFTIQFYVNNERFDKGVMIQNLTNLKQSGTFTGSMEKLDEAILDLIGLSGRQFRKTKAEKEAEMAQMAQMEQIKAQAGGPMNTPAPLSDAQQFGNTSSPVSQSA
jgi:hypothetical protein